MNIKQFKEFINTTIEFNRKMKENDEKQNVILEKKLVYRQNNSNNYTELGITQIPDDIVKIGKNTYGTINVHYYNTENEKLTIGSYCSIADDVHFFTAGEHDYRNFSTYPFRNKISGGVVNESLSNGPIVVEDGAWIGFRSIILSGVTIGKGAVIGAGSVVAKNVPPYAIYADGRVIKYRFSKEVIKKVESIDLNKLPLEKASEIIETLYTNIDENNVEELIDRIKKICV